MQHRLFCGAQDVHSGSYRWAPRLHNPDFTLTGERAGLGSDRANTSMSGMTERRTTRRYDRSLPILIRVPAKKGEDSQHGKTRDISTRGLYFVIDQNLEAGSELDLTLTLPSEVTRGSEVFVRALGRVLRVEQRIEDGNTRMGVAAVIERYDILRGEAARA